MSRRWWVPLLAALVVDAGLIAHHEVAAATRVNRAVQKATAGGQCREAVLSQTTGVNDLSVVDAWQGKGTIYTQLATVSFVRGTTLTAKSVQSIELGQDLGPVTANPPGAASTLGGSYRAQLARGISWLTGPCIPMVNPFQSGMRRLGQFFVATEPYSVFQGRITVNRGGGQPLIPNASVWIATGGDGRIAFEVLRTTDAVSIGDPQTVAASYTYPTERMAAMERHETVKEIERFYTSTYTRLLAAVQVAKYPDGNI